MSDTGLAAAAQPGRVTDSSGPAATSEPDQSLLARCRRGDAAAWEELVNRYERLVFTVAVRNGVSRPDAADVAQLTFMALLDSIDTLRDDERLASWLMTVARRQAWRARRRGEREVSVPEVVVEAEDTQAMWDRVADLHSGLGRLGGPCRDLLSALYLEPQPAAYVDVARRLGRAVGAIGPMRARCLLRLRRLMEGPTG